MQLFQPFEELQHRKMELSFMTEITDMQEYGEAWMKLARDYDALGLLTNAEYCRSRGEHYLSLTMVTAVRRVDGCLAELVEA